MKFSAEEIFRKTGCCRLLNNGEEIQAARMIDRIPVKSSDRILIPGAGLLDAHPVACATQGPEAIHIVQPPYYRKIPQTQNLNEGITEAHQLIYQEFGLDIASKIDTKSFPCLVEDANLPENYYTLVFALDMFDIIQSKRRKRRAIGAICNSLRNKALIFFSTYTSHNGITPQEMIDRLQAEVAKEGYSFATEIRLIRAIALVTEKIEDEIRIFRTEAKKFGFVVRKTGRVFEGIQPIFELKVSRL